MGRCWYENPRNLSFCTNLHVWTHCHIPWDPDKNYGRVYPQISLAITLFNALGSVLIGSLYDMLGSYSGIILMVAAMMAVVMVIIVMAYRKKANQMKSI